MNRQRRSRLDALMEILESFPEGITIPFLQEHFAIDRATAYRDLQKLQERGVELIRDGQSWRLERIFWEAKPTFSKYEAVAIYLGGRLLARQSDEHNTHVVSALRKLGASLARHAPVIADFMQSAGAEVETRPSQPAYVQAFEALTEGWLTLHKVRVLYHSAQGAEPHERLFHPYFLEPMQSGNSIYVVGFDESHQAPRTFKLERILFAAVTEFTFEMPQAVMPREMFASAWGIMWGTADIEVQLRFEASAVRRLHETYWHPTQHYVPQPDGGTIFSVHIAHTLEMVPWIRGWGAQVEVLTPPDLRARFAQESQELAERYRA